MQVLYRSAAPGILTGVLLALARISGETAPLLFTALNNQYWSADLTKPMASVPVVIFQYAMSPYDSWHSLAWAGAFMVTLFVLVLSLASRAVILRHKVPND
jgi:phosphate transport system permease protein